jgi:hypothetical protein
MTLLNLLLYNKNVESKFLKYFEKSMSSTPTFGPSFQELWAVTTSSRNLNGFDSLLQWILWIYRSENWNVIRTELLFIPATEHKYMNVLNCSKTEEHMKDNVDLTEVYK